MGFTEACRLTIEALLDGRFQHEPRPHAAGKNLLASGEVPVDHVVDLLRGCRGSQHDVSPHHADPTIDVHIFKPVRRGVRWYIKSYLVEIDDITAVFISVHESEF